jgi:hypothetical protein
VITLRGLAEQLPGEYGAAGSGNRKDHHSDKGNGKQQERRHREAKDSKAPRSHRGTPIR